MTQLNEVRIGESLSEVERCDLDPLMEGASQSRIEELMQ